MATRARADLLMPFGLALRASRRARRWTQVRLARELGISVAHVSRLERAEVPDLSLALASRALEAAGGRLDLRFLAATVSAPSVRDAAHARCVAYVLRKLSIAGWLVATEVEVTIGGGRWRSFVDVLAFHPGQRIVLAIEVKTEIVDLGEIDRQLGIGERGAWEAVRQRGWRPRRVVPVLLILATEENDRRLSEHRAWFDAGFKLRWRGLGDLAVGLGPTAPPALGSRGLAMIDPRSRRRSWLLPTRLDGRRTPARYRDRVEYLAEPRRSIQSGR